MQPRSILALAVTAPLARSHQHIQRKQDCLLRRCLVCFQNEIADDHAPLRRQRLIAALQQIAIPLRPKHVTNSRNENHIESLAEKACAKIPSPRLDSRAQPRLFDVPLRDRQHLGKSSNST